jgi:Asp-tRNA(Asn)/Glu-tRNA(Gln) amidotransferase A subunit family amidase
MEHKLTAWRNTGGVEAVAAAANGDTTIASIAEKLADEVEKTDPSIHAFLDFDRRRLLCAASALDRRPQALRGPLHGLTIAVKEVFDVMSYRCAWGLPSLRSRVATRDAALVAHLKKLGALVAGTTISTELAIARSGPTRNPLDTSLTPGGSSSGSAAAVAAGMVPLAIGSQTIGSIIRPAAYCGVFGFKPSQGLLDLAGMMPLAPQLDHAGFLARNLDDLQLIEETCLRRHPKKIPASIRRVLVAAEDKDRPLKPAFLWAIRACTMSLSRLDIDVAPLQMPLTFSDGFMLAESIVAYNIAKLHGKLLQRSREQISPRLISLLAQGQRMSHGEYELALARCDAATRSITEQIGHDAIILAPSSEDFAPKWSEHCSGSPVYQALWTLTGLPTLSIPVRKEEEALPVSIQLIAPQFDDATLLRFAKQLCIVLQQNQPDENC